MKKMLTVLLCTIMAVTPAYSMPVYAAEAGTEPVTEEDALTEEQSASFGESEAAPETEIEAELQDTGSEMTETQTLEVQSAETMMIETQTAETADLEMNVSETDEAETVESESDVIDEELPEETAAADKNLGASSGIKGNGTGGIYIDVNSSPYSDAWATDIAYTSVGCTWFVAARVKQLTGLSNFPTVYGCDQWWNWYGESLGFTKGTATPNCKAVIVYDTHVAILEKIEGNTAYISEGGRATADMAQHGYTEIRSMSVSELTNGGFLGCGNFIGYVYMNQCPFDVEPPVFHGKAKAYPVGTNGAQFVFEASDNKGITKYAIKVWKYGQNESEAVDFSARTVEFSYDGSKFYSVRMSTSDFGGFLGPYHVACYVYDAAGNQAISFVKDSVSFYECKPGNKVTGTYKVTADPATERCAPYAEVGGENTKTGTRPKGDKISVVGSYTNDKGNLWYQTNSGSWIYSENVEHYNWFMEQLDKLKNLFDKIVFYWCGQTVQKEAALDVASQLSDAMKSSNFAVLDVSVIQRTADQAANAFSYSTVTFDPNGGSCGTGQLTYVTGSAFGALPGAYRFGYTFDGWFTAADGGDLVTADSICGGSQTLYAHWTRIILLEGECGPNLHFVLYGDGILEVTGYGEMTSHPWTSKFAGRVLEAQLPEEVTSICSAAFKGCTYLEIINIPSQITEIKGETFYGCTYLDHVTIPETVATIGGSAFYKCETLSKIVIPDAVTALATSTFEGCTSLADVTLSQNLKTMKNRVFANDTALGSIWIPKSLDSCTHYVGSNHDQGPFTGCSGLKDVTFETGITSIAEGVFAGCTGIEQIVIPDTVTEIESYSFPYCTALREVNFGNSVTKIGASAFHYDSALTAVVLPDTVTDLYKYSFAGCSSLSEVTLSKNLKHMAEWAFSEDTSLTSIVIPKNLDYCDYYQDGTSAQGPFHHCSNLKNVVFEDGITIIPAGVFASCTGIEEIVIPDTATEIEKWSFANCTNLSKVTIGNAVKEIGSGSFYNTAISSIVIPDSVTDLYRYVFAKCSNLAEVKLSKNLKHMAEWVFSEDSALTSIVIPKKLDYADYYTTGAGAQGPFYHCSNLKNVTFEEGITIIPAGIFAACEGIEEIVIPDTVVELEKYCFANCSNLSKVTMSSQVKEIGTASFYNDAKLTEMTLPETMTALYGPCFYGSGITKIRIPGGITSIPEKAFQGCFALETIDWSLADSLKTISANAFCDCTALKETVIPAGVTTIGNYAFNNCDTMIKVVVPDSVTSLGTYAFASGEALTDVKLGRGITSLPASLFAGDSALESIIVPGRVTSIGTDVFKNAVAFTSIVIPKSVTAINISAFSYPQNLTIYGIAGSYAETFANENDITFIAREVPAEKVTLSETSLELMKNASRTLTLTVEPEEYTDDVIWKSTNTDVATVSDIGLVKAVSGGTTVIKVSVGDITASCTVTVLQPVTSISLSKTKATIEQGDTLQLTATVNPSSANNKNILWSSSDESIASVDENGLITANAVGTATITAAAADGSGVKATCAVTVQKSKTICESVDELESSHPYANSSDLQWIYTLGGAETLLVTFDAQTATEEGCDYIYIYDKDGNQVGVYSGSQLAGKTIEVPGDTITIRLTSDSSVNDWGFKVVSVEEKGDPVQPVTVTSISLNTTSKELKAGESLQLTATVLPENADNKTLQWSSSNTSAASVNSNGLVTAKAAGTAVITAAATDGSGVKATCAITVKEAGIPATDIYFLNSGDEWPAGRSFALIAHIRPDNATDFTVTWTSSNPKVAEVDNGLVTVHTYGTAVITATLKSGNLTKTANYTVNARFNDVMESSKYYYTPVYWAAKEGITAGYSDGSFGVGKNCQRRELLIFMWRFAGQPVKDKKGNAYGDARKMFNDMSAYGTNSAANKAVAWAYKEGIVKGYSDGGIHPTDSIVRKDVMIMLYRLAGKPAVSGTLTFKDCQNFKKTSDTYKAILWGSTKKITNGYSSGQYAGQFGVSLNCLREQIVTFLYRYNNIK